MEEIKNKIKEFYKKYNINIEIIETVESLSVTSIFLKVDTTETPIKKVEKLVDDLALFLCIENISFFIDYTKGAFVLQIPNKQRKILKYDEIRTQTENKQGGLFVNLGQTTENKIKQINICGLPHLLLAGTTGSGKSILLNTILLQLFENYTPEALQVVLVDPKQVDFESFANVPHLKTNIIKTLEETKSGLNGIIAEIEQRYNILKLSNTKNIENYNKKASQKMPYILIIIDELADLLIQDNKSKLKSDILGEKRLEDLLVRIAQIGRACGVHLILATQRPSSDVLTGLIKANVPARIALSTATATDSRIILDTKGAEKLTGNGDALIKEVGQKELLRFQGAFISEEEQETLIKNIINKYKKHTKQPQLIQEHKETPKPTQPTKEETEEDKNNKIIIGVLLAVIVPFLLVLFVSNGNFWALIVFFIIASLTFSIIAGIIKLVKKLK